MIDVLNCTAEANLIDSNTVSIKYIVGGWLTLIFCIFGKIPTIKKKQILFFMKIYFIILRYYYQYFYCCCFIASAYEKQFNTCLFNGIICM